VKRFWVYFLAITTASTLHGQVSESKASIPGRWDLVEVIKDTTIQFEPLTEITTDDPEEVEKSDPKDEEVVFYFGANNEFQEIFHGLQYRSAYRFISEDVMIIGETTYRILRLDKQEFRIQRYEEGLLSLGEPDILVFERSEKPFKLIKEYEEHVSYYGNGKKKSEGLYHNGREHGPWKQWYPNGQLKSEEMFRDGLPVGKFIRYHENGRIHQVGFRDQFTYPTGTWKTWDEKGQLLEEVDHNR
jgi:hypothetical protein